MSIERLKELLGADNEINELIDNALNRNFIDQNGLSTSKNDSFPSTISSLVDKNFESTYLMFKVEGIRLTNVELDVFDLIRDSVHSLINLAWNKQKDVGYKFSMNDYEKSVNLSLIEGSFQVDIELPSVAKHETEMSIKSLIENIASPSDEAVDLDKTTNNFLIPIQNLLSRQNITGIKISTDRSIKPDDAPEIAKSKINKIQQSLTLYTEQQAAEVNANVFSEDVIIFASNSKLKTFSAYAQDMKVFNFDCSEASNADAWWHIINNQVESVNDLSNTTRVHIIGTVENAKKIKVTETSINN
jgi:hypothetical protein